MRSKYNSSKVQICGIWFDSKAEGRRYLELLSLAEMGEITDLKTHPVYELLGGFTHQLSGIKVRKITYEADFAYKRDSLIVVEDVKGVKRDLYVLKKKLFLSKYPDCFFVELTKKTHPHLFVGGRL